MRHQSLLAAGLILVGGLAGTNAALAADKETSLVEQGQ